MRWIKIATVGLTLAGIALIAFAWWGLNSALGRTMFDEMDGLYPFFGGVAGSVLLVLALVLFGFSRWKRHQID